MSMKPDKTCIIGAGAAGIAAAKALSDKGIAFDWFEAGSKLGGIWRYDNDSGSSVYASLRTNTSQTTMEWFGYPMPNRANDYLTHEQVLAYLESFAARANLVQKTTFATRVTSVEPLEERGFAVSVQSRSGEMYSRNYGAVIVAVGCHSMPKWPKIAGMLNGHMMHASEYRSADIFAGKNVVVAGFGASGADIACDAAAVASSVILSTRRGGYVLPRYVDGKPRDEANRPWMALVPLAIRKQRWKIMLMQRPVSPKVRAALERDTSPFAKPAVLNDRLPAMIDRDRILVKPVVERFEGHRVIFSDRSSAPCDVFICATGYEFKYPFFSSQTVHRTGSFAARYLRVVPPSQPDLYFLGRLSAVGPFFPVFEKQAVWVSDLLTGRCVLPSTDELERCAAREAKASSVIFPDAGRETDIVEYYSYLRALKRELAAGRARALKATRPPASPSFALTAELGE